MSELYAGKRVVILGLARQGTALARFLARAGAVVTVSDAKPAEQLEAALASLGDLPITRALGGHPLDLLDACDLLCLSGGVPLDLPIVQAARARGIPLSNDAEITLANCPATLTLGITGSAGKTTTTTLVGEMCKAGGYRTWVGGNIGNPLIEDTVKMGAGDRVIMELSSFQLELVDHAPRIAGVLNITPNHLDRHPDMASYIAAKARIITQQTAESVAVLGYDDPIARGLAAQAPGRVVYFTGAPEGEQVAEAAAFLRGERVMVRQNGQVSSVCDTRELKVPGRHNVLNVLAACALCAQVDVPVPAMRSIALNFRGVAHRLELVRERLGVRWYDDSIATAPERTIAALLSFDAPLVLLAGGRDKHLPWDEFARLACERVVHLVLFGEAAPMIAEVVARYQATAKPARAPEVHMAGTLAAAVECAAQVARLGDVVLLSPGGTSYDAFKDFAERGDQFKQYVQAL